MSLFIQIVQGQFKIRSNFNKTLEANLAFFRDEPKIINVHFVNPQKIKQLNKKFMNKDEECAVLSFPLDVKCPAFVKTSAGKQMLNVKCYEVGDIFICRQVAKKKGYSVHNLLVHGLMHITSLDHKTLSDVKKWERIEEDINKKLWV